MTLVLICYGLSKDLSSGPLLLKPHGSLNWYEAARIRKVAAEKRVQIFPHKEGSERIEAFLRPREIESKSGRRYTPLILPPTYLKDFSRPVFRRLWNRCTEVLSTPNRELAEKGQRVSVRGRVYTRLGNPPGYDTSRASAARQPVKPSPQVIELMQRKRAEGLTYRAIADHLDSMGIRTPRGHRWQNETIPDILNRQLKVAA